jgi:hypothetical protein
MQAAWRREKPGRNPGTRRWSRSPGRKPRRMLRLTLASRAPLFQAGGLLRLGPVPGVSSTVCDNAHRHRRRPSPPAGAGAARHRVSPCRTRAEDAAGANPGARRRRKRRDRPADSGCPRRCVRRCPFWSIRLLTAAGPFGLEGPNSSRNDRVVGTRNLEIIPAGRGRGFSSPCSLRPLRLCVGARRPACQPVPFWWSAIGPSAAPTRTAARAAVRRPQHATLERLRDRWLGGRCPIRQTESRAIASCDLSRTNRRAPPAAFRLDRCRSGLPRRIFRRRATRSPGLEPARRPRAGDGHGAACAGVDRADAARERCRCRAAATARGRPDTARNRRFADRRRASVPKAVLAAEPALEPPAPRTAHAPCLGRRKAGETSWPGRHLAVAADGDAGLSVLVQRTEGDLQVGDDG